MQDEKTLSENSERATPKFKIEGTYFKDKCFPSLNDYLHECGRNPIAGGRMKDKCMNVAIASIRRDLKGIKIKPPVIIHYKFYEPIKGQKRDVMNIFSMADKVIEDALVKTKTLPDDNPRIVKNTTHEFFYDNRTRIEVEIEEVSDAKD